MSGLTLSVTASNIAWSFISGVPVAQRIERLPSKQRVAGSNPAWDASILSQCALMLLVWEFVPRYKVVEFS